MIKDYIVETVMVVLLVIIIALATLLQIKVIEHSKLVNSINEVTAKYAAIKDDCEKSLPRDQYCKLVAVPMK